MSTPSHQIGREHKLMGFTPRGHPMTPAERARETLAQAKAKFRGWNEPDATDLAEANAELDALSREGLGIREMRDDLGCGHQMIVEDIVDRVLHLRECGEPPAAARQELRDMLRERGLAIVPEDPTGVMIGAGMSWREIDLPDNVPSVFRREWCTWQAMLRASKQEETADG